MQTERNVRHVSVLIVGAGPTGIGAAYRLHELTSKSLGAPTLSWRLVDAQTVSGGAAASATSRCGFTWDRGSHVIYSRYPYFDRWLARIMGSDLLWHERKGWVWVEGRLIPAPIQQNLHLLPRSLASASVGEITHRMARHSGADRALNYEQWLLQRYGASLAGAFFLPHSRKMWAHPLDSLSTQWVDMKSGSSQANVPDIDMLALFSSALSREPFEGWKQNPPFPYPARGGNGELWRRGLADLPETQVELGKRLVAIDADAHRASFHDGSTVTYEWMISSLPLTRLVSLCQLSDAAMSAAAALKHASVRVVGLGFRGPTPRALAHKFWIYVADAAIPFFRITVPSNFSPNNTPEAGRYWSVMCEAGFSRSRPLEAEGIIDLAAGAVQSMIGEDPGPMIEAWQQEVEFAYPVPTLGRDEGLQAVDRDLQRRHILSRGRFGAWKYETGNQDSSFMQGVEAVDRVLFGTEELTYARPELIGEGLIDRVLA